MKRITMQDVIGTERTVRCPRGGFVSYRLLLASDRMGFSLHITHVPPGPPQHWHYPHHLEACYCVSGKGELVNLRTGERVEIFSGALYALDEHDDHTFQALAPTVLVSVFNPPCHGTEVHAADGTYPAGLPGEGWR